jgi:HSP20 family protein
MLTRYEHWNAFRQLHDELNRGVPSDVAKAQWVPAVDISEEEGRFVVLADVPGIDPADIEVTTEKNTLTIKGERKQVSEDAREGLKRVERLSGTFYRRFTLPDEVDAENVTALGRHGVLEISIPKREAVQSRRIPVAA